MGETEKLEIHETAIQHRAHEIWREIVANLLKSPITQSHSTNDP